MPVSATGRRQVRADELKPGDWIATRTRTLEVSYIQMYARADGTWVLIVGADDATCLRREADELVALAEVDW